MRNEMFSVFSLIANFISSLAKNAKTVFMNSPFAIAGPFEGSRWPRSLFDAAGGMLAAEHTTWDPLLGINAGPPNHTVR